MNHAVATVIELLYQASVASAPRLGPRPHQLSRLLLDNLSIAELDAVIGELDRTIDSGVHIWKELSGELATSYLRVARERILSHIAATGGRVVNSRDIDGCARIDDAAGCARLFEDPPLDRVALVHLESFDSRLWSALSGARLLLIVGADVEIWPALPQLKELRSLHLVQPSRIDATALRQAGRLEEVVFHTDSAVEFPLPVGPASVRTVMLEGGRVTIQDASSFQDFAGTITLRSCKATNSTLEWLRNMLGARLTTDGAHQE